MHLYPHRPFPIHLLTLPLFLLADTALAATPWNIVVTSNADSGPGTLRAAIFDANSHNAVADTITFTLTPPNNVITITSALAVGDPVNIDGYNGGNYVKLIGSGTSAHAGISLSLFSDGSTISNLSVMNCNEGIQILSSNNVITHCWLGTDWANATAPGGNRVGVSEGVNQNNNRIGGLAPADTNVISNNTTFGIHSNFCTNTRIWGNLIGTNNAGSAALGSQAYGIEVTSGTSLQICGSAPGQGNLISGNATYGVDLNGGSGTVIDGNLIGLSLDQTTAVPNGTGVNGQSADAVIGLPSGTGNVIAGNTQYNVHVVGAFSRNWRIQHNLIGLNQSDQAFDSIYGVLLENANANLIGGDALLDEGNVISGHSDSSHVGVFIMGSGNTVSGNAIGTNAAGTQARANDTGILIQQGNGNLIGGVTSGSQRRGNLVSGNIHRGIDIELGQGNSIVGNFIGVDLTGSSALPNEVGIYLATPTLTLVGGSSPSTGNVISGNTYQGILADGTGNTVIGNYIGCSANGALRVPNRDSLYLTGSFTRVENNFLCDTAWLVGGANLLVGNVIGVLPSGAAVTPALTTGLIISGTSNRIGLAHDRGNLIANTGTGIDVNLGDYNSLYANTVTAFASFGILLQNNGNNNYAAPSITSAFPDGIQGTAQAGDYIEIFLAEPRPGGRGGALRLLGYTTASGSGNWSVSPGGYSAGDYVCALATSAAGDTSQYSINALVSTPTPTRTPTFTATRTATLTPTRSVTFTPTPTHTASATRSATYTATPVLSATPTSTPSPTATPTPILSATLVATATRTRTPAPSPAGPAVYPNPCRDSASILVTGRPGALAFVAIYNIAGEKVAELRETLSNDRQRLVWDCRRIASGVYQVRVNVTGEKEERHKIAVTR